MSIVSFDYYVYDIKLKIQKWPMLYPAIAIAQEELWIETEKMIGFTRIVSFYIYDIIAQKWRREPPIGLDDLRLSRDEKLRDHIRTIMRILAKIRRDHADIANEIAGLLARLINTNTTRLIAF